VHALLLAGWLLAGIDDEEIEDPGARAAVIKLEQKDWKGAQAAAAAVLKNKGASKDAKHIARRSLGMALLRMSHLKEAKQTLLAALLESPDDPYTIARLGECEEAMGLHREAKARLENLKTKAALPDVDTHLALARALYALGEEKAARMALDEAISQMPDYPGVVELKAKMDKEKKGRERERLIQQ
jgi:tetratricopeptide (TPR) repeat protein